MGQRKNQSKHRRRRATKHRSRKHRGGSYLGTAAAYIFNERHMVDAKTFSDKVVELIQSDDTYDALRNYATDIQHAVECYIMSKQFSIYLKNLDNKSALNGKWDDASRHSSV